MTNEPADWRQGSPPSLVSEIDYIINSFAELPEEQSTGGKGQGIRIGVATTDGEVDYLYDERHILVLDHQIGPVLAIVGHTADVDLRPDPDGPISPVIAGRRERGAGRRGQFPHCPVDEKFLLADDQRDGRFHARKHATIGALKRIYPSGGDGLVVAPDVARP